MGKSNKLLKNIFSDYFTKTGKSYIDFLIVQNEKELQNQEIDNFKSEYIEIIENYKWIFNLLGYIEKLIIQLRCKENLIDNLKLYYLNDYLYARTVFLKSNKIKDIRVPIGKSNTLPSTNIEVLQNNEIFMSGVIQKMITSMNKEITKTKDIIILIKKSNLNNILHEQN